MAAIKYAQWQDEHRHTKFPFAADSSLSNGTQSIPDGIILDAILHPIGGNPRMFLQSVEVTHDTVTLIIGDLLNDAIASGSFSTTSPPDSVRLVDPSKRPAGLLVSEPVNLSLFASWGIGIFNFNIDQTEFTATCCIPQPQPGVRGVQLPDGTVLTGEVWLVGGAGVILRHEQIHGDQEYAGIRVDVVGDPLFRRRLCTPVELFQSPQFLTKLAFTDGTQEVVITPDNLGGILMTVNNDLASDTILRIHPTPTGNVIDTVGATQQGG